MWSPTLHSSLGGQAAHRCWESENSRLAGGCLCRDYPPSKSSTASAFISTGHDSLSGVTPAQEDASTERQENHHERFTPAGPIMSRDLCRLISIIKKETYYQVSHESVRVWWWSLWILLECSKHCGEFSDLLSEKCKTTLSAWLRLRFMADKQCFKSHVIKSP